MGRYDVNRGGPEWRKWCGLADEPRFTREFVRWESWKRKRRLADEPTVDVLAAYDWCGFYEVCTYEDGRLVTEWAEVSGDRHGD